MTLPLLRPTGDLRTWFQTSRPTGGVRELTGATRAAELGAAAVIARDAYGEMTVAGGRPSRRARLGQASSGCANPDGFVFLQCSDDVSLVGQQVTIDL